MAINITAKRKVIDIGRFKALRPTKTFVTRLRPKRDKLVVLVPKDEQLRSHMKRF